MVKTYMLYGLQGYTDLRPQQVFPANLFLYDIRQTALHDGTGGKSVRVKKRNLQRQKKSDSTTNRNVEDGGRKNHSSPIPTQSFCAYTFRDSAHNMMATESSLETSLYPVWLKTSDSDFSDTEAGQAAKNRVTQGRVRKSALSLLITVTKVCDRKLLFGYWSSLLPDGPNMFQAPTLCTSLLKDPSPHSRMLVPQSLILMLTGSRLYLSQAEKSSKSSIPFTPFSVTIGNMVRELHQSLCLALPMENSIPVITQLLKCLAALVQNTPYHRLEPGLITRVVRNVKPHLRHKDSDVQVASLTVLGSIVAVEPSTPEITDILCKSSISSRQKHCDTGLIPESEYKMCRDHDGEKCQQPGSNQDADYEDELEDGTDAFVDCISTDVNNQMSWLLEVCLRNLQPSSLKEGIRTVNAGGGAVFLPCSAPVRVECLQVLTVLARNYYTQVISSHIGQLMQLLGQTLSDGNVTICLHSGRVIEALGNSMQQCLQEQGGTTGVSLDKNLQFWQTILSGPLISLVQNAEQAALRAAGCDCLATIGTGVFEQLPRDKQILIVTLLFGCSHDEEISVRSSALRALGVCVLFPTLREDIHFIIDTSDCVIRTLHDESLLVRMKASWSLGNLSEALVLNSMADDIEDIPTELLLKLMETSIKVTRDNDKVRSSAVRAVGNFVRLITEEMMNKSNFREFNDKAITALVRNATTGNNMKVRWNACYAIGNTMRNSALYLENSAWQNTVFTTIMNLVQDVRNFKVRISAALALSIPQSRQQYGSYYITAWTALLNGLDNSQNMEDFSEYKHCDNLLDQICLTMGHLASLATRDDLTFLHDILIFHLDTLKHHLLKFHERVVPEKAGVLSAASSHATSLLQLQGLTSSQHNAATVLVSIFLQDPDLPLQYN
ncbi:hypothetical protein B7P43_G12519 [Cryptotermes secundus]|nr:hypothetical protein B7P43_G12519 [Cryptotermes secundus]